MRRVASFFLIAMSVMVGCQSHKYVTGQIDEEAKKQAELYWAASFSKCDDSYFGVYAPKGVMPKSDLLIVEMKDPFYFTYHKMDDVTLTEADKLNQLEWIGKTFMQPKASRYYTDGQWKDWLNYGSGLEYKLTSLDVRKIHGRWEFGSPNSDRYLAIPCEQVPR